MSEDQILCNCYSVTVGEVIKAVKDGADTVEKVGEVTNAGTGCGGCQDQIQEIIDANK